jgi:acyl-CoA synthetase (AMP-forming)/AMP-acid ligase II
MDRIGDTFRWRSENVSTAEVAEVLGNHPAVLEANVYGVAIPNHEGRAGCAAVLLKGIETNTNPIPDALLESFATYSRNSLPRYAVPVFLRVVTQVMATGNNKQQKHVLRQEGVDPAKTGGDRIFYLRPDSQRYEPFGPPEWEAVKAGKAKL